MAEDVEKPILLHRQLQSIAEYREALDILIEFAQHRLRIFDYSLEDGDYNSPQRFELLRTFLLASRSNRLEIVVHDTDHILRRCPRMLMLLKEFSHAVSIRETTAEAKGIFDPFAVADQTHYVHRFHYDSPRALLALNDVEGSHALIKRFEEICAASSPAMPATPLGL